MLTAVVALVVIVAVLLYPRISQPDESPVITDEENILTTPAPEGQSPKNCQQDADCLVFGQDGDCNCGCFNKNYRWEKEGDCFCAAPRACQCIENECQGVFEEAKPDSEICQDETTGEQLTLSDALQIAQNSECGQQGELLESWLCNQNTGTWWIDLDIDKPDCNPACVIKVTSQEAEINWRCTGLIPQD